MKENNDPVKIYYVETDHLGSILALFDSQSGQKTYAQSFDAWGRERNPQTWDYTSNTTTKPEWLIRGYTGHEHLPEFGLINMNGRMYDPVLGRMLSPDIYVHDATSTQGYNRYSYVLNNPLKYVDPDGNEPITLAIILGIKLLSKVAVKIAAKKGVSVKLAKAANKTVSITKSKTFSNSVAGSSNMYNNTDFDEAGWGWEALGHFGAGYLGSAVGINGHTEAAFSLSGTLTMLVNEFAGDHDGIYDVYQSFVGGGLSGLLGKNLYKNALGVKSEGFWGKWYGKGVKYGNEAYAGFFAFDKEDKFLKTPLYSHLGIYAAGFANGVIVAGFDEFSEDIFDELGATKGFAKSGIELGVRSLGVGTEFGLTSFAKSKYKTINGKGFGSKAGKGSLKNLGYILTTYY